MTAKSALLPDRPPVDSEPTPGVYPLLEAGEVIDALTSETARSMLQALLDEPKPISALATATGVSIQTASYHLGKLQAAGLIEEVDTWYSAKGREMSVYAPVHDVLVVTAGAATGTSGD